MNAVITKDEFDKKYVGEKIVVRCLTEELTEEFLTMVDKFGYKWWTGDRYIDNINYEPNYCYDIKKGYFSPKDYYLKEGFNIVEFNGFKEDKDGKSSVFKVVIELIDEEKSIILIMCEERIIESFKVLVDQKNKDVFFEMIDKSVFYIKKEYIKYVKTEVLYVKY